MHPGSPPPFKEASLFNLAKEGGCDGGDGLGIGVDGVVTVEMGWA